MFVIYLTWGQTAKFKDHQYFQLTIRYLTCVQGLQWHRHQWTPSPCCTSWHTAVLCSGPVTPRENPCSGETARNEICREKTHAMVCQTRTLQMKERSSVSNLSLENNLPMFRLNAPVVIRAKVKRWTNVAIYSHALHVKLFSQLKLVTDNLLCIYAEANWEATEEHSDGLLGMRLVTYQCSRISDKLPSLE